MKKAFFLSLILSSLSLVAFSQDVRVGLHGGLTISDIESPYNEMNHGVKLGYMAGIMVDVPIGSKFSFRPELNYVQKGNLLREDANQKIYNALRYAELSPNFVYDINEGNVVFFLGAGPSLAFSVPSKKVTDPKEGESFYSDILFGKTPENDFKGIDWGVNFLGGIKFSNRFLLNAVYNMGIRDLNPKADNAGSIKTKYFAIQVGYLFK